jgi:hypothetical protein
MGPGVKPARGGTHGAVPLLDVRTWRRSPVRGNGLRLSEERPCPEPETEPDHGALPPHGHGVFSESANAAHWLGGFVATPPEDKTAPRAFPSERSGVGHGDYLIRTFLLRAVAAFGTWTVKIPS